MPSRFHSGVKLEEKEKRECSCVTIKVGGRVNGDKEPQVVDVECSSHPGMCVLDEHGMCTKRKNALHCVEIPIPQRKGEKNVKCKKSCCKITSGAKGSNPKVHCYKIDLNNSKDTGLIADKQCQTCGSECSPATCSTRSRQYFISWDKIRTKVFLFLILLFILWLTIYSALSLTSNL